MIKLFETIVGSHAYGTNVASSDIDIRGIFAYTYSEKLSLLINQDEIRDDKQDYKLYELEKFFQLAMKCNPNIIELLWSPTSCIKTCVYPMDLLFENRDAFLSQAAYTAFVGYSRAQVSKARGRNKWINNPQPEERPTKELFCWFIREDSMYPFRPQTVKTLGLNLDHFHVSALEHVQHVYRLYHFGPRCNGVFRNDTLVCESIPIKDESKCIGLLLYNKDAYDKAVRDWKHYWDWVNNRSDARWESQEGENKLDYDSKNMHHCVRLLLSGESLLSNGVPIVKFEGEPLQLLMDIRNGVLTYKEIMDYVDEKMQALDECLANTSLRKKPDFKHINDLYLKMMEIVNEGDNGQS